MTNMIKLIAYAESFVSFLLDSDIGKSIDKAILFGSVARGDFDKESDVDIFIDCKPSLERDIMKLLKLFESSETNRLWQLKGIRNKLSVKVGKLSEWKLRRDIISAGIMLYGKYSELPDNSKYIALIKIDVSSMKTAVQMSIWRALYGYKQKIGNKTYETKGIVNELGGKKLAPALFAIPMDKNTEMVQFLNQKRIKYEIYELWSDTLL